MKLSEIKTEFRNQVSDAQLPHLWSDDEIFGYVVDAQDTFCRLTGGIGDYSTTALTDIAVTAHTPFAAFSPYILRIRSGKLLTAKLPVRFAQEGDMTLLRMIDYGVQRPTILDDDDEGDVVAGILGLEEHKVRWYRVPAVTDTCRMHILRLPYPRLVTWDDTAPQLEIDEQHHRALLLRMRELAYEKQDAETYDKNASEKYRDQFEAYCARAKTERQRIAYRPRVIQYGGY